MEELVREMTDFRRKLHRHPELSEDELETSRHMISKLEEWGINYRKSTGTDIVPWVTKGEGKDIGFCADMDALPIQEDPENLFASQENSVMHACGHDYHVAIHLLLLRIAQLWATLKMCFSAC